MFTSIHRLLLYRKCDNQVLRFLDTVLDEAERNRPQYKHRSTSVVTTDGVLSARIPPVPFFGGLSNRYPTDAFTMSLLTLVPRERAESELCEFSRGKSGVSPPRQVPGTHLATLARSKLTVRVNRPRGRVPKLSHFLKRI